jgi:hypothetical protein
MDWGRTEQARSGATCMQSTIERVKRHVHPSASSSPAAFLGEATDSIALVHVRRLEIMTG